MTDQDAFWIKTELDSCKRGLSDMVVEASTLRSQLKASQEVAAAFMNGVLDLQADVKLLREALEAYDDYFGDGEGEVHSSCDCDNCKTAYRIISQAKTALAATAPKEGR